MRTSGGKATLTIKGMPRDVKSAIVTETIKRGKAKYPRWKCSNGAIVEDALAEFEKTMSDSAIRHGNIAWYERREKGASDVVRVDSIVKERASAKARAAQVDQDTYTITAVAKYLGLNG